MLYPAVAAAARGAGATAVGLVEVGSSTSAARGGVRPAGGVVSVEEIGVLPSIPTLGDRRAPGHSTVGLALVDRSTMGSEAVGRCWSQRRSLSFLVDT